jgi:hypothetical protein
MDATASSFSTRSNVKRITTVLNRLVDRLAKLEVRVLRENPRLPDLRSSSPIYRRKRSSGPRRRSRICRPTIRASLRPSCVA